MVWAIFGFFIETRIALHYFVTFLSFFCLFNLCPCGKLNQTWKTKLSKREKQTKSERNKSIKNYPSAWWPLKGAHFTRYAHGRTIECDDGDSVMTDIS